jgi:hypothetical protein
MRRHLAWMKRSVVRDRNQAKARTPDIPGFHFISSGLLMADSCSLDEAQRNPGTTDARSTTAVAWMKRSAIRGL